MPYLDKYKNYLEGMSYNLRRIEEEGRYTVFGYTSDLDVLIKWDVHKFNQVIAEHLIEKPHLEEFDVISDISSFARIVSYYVINGMGGEINITDIGVCEYLEKQFETYPALGGTCAQGAAALGALGVPLIAHITDRSKEVCEFLDYPHLSLFSGGKTLPARMAASDEAPIRHMILQYNKGDVIYINGEQYTIPLSNRLIMDYDHIHSYLPIDPEFLEFCDNNAGNFYSYNISGFNAITDLEILKERVSELVKHYHKMKAQNPSCILYLESAHYLNSKCKNHTFTALSKCIDILGMNGEELVDLCREFGMMVDEENLESVLNGLEVAIKKYPVKGIVMHTKDYSMYFGCELEKADMEKGLTMGNLMSGTKARIGRYGYYQDCVESLSLPLSQVGISLVQQLEVIKTSRYVCIVPSRYMEHPIDTIGLGDTFVAGMQLGFI